MTLHSYHETVPEPRVIREAYQRRAKTQEIEVLAFFRAHPGRAFSREEIEATFSYPTQTASRVLADLTAQLALEKTGDKAVSSFGRRCGTWRLSRPSPVVQERLGL